MIKWISILLTCLLLSNTVGAIETPKTMQELKRDSSTKVNLTAIYAERCTGSSFLHALIQYNIPQLGIWPFTHKHFPPWFELPQEHWLGLPKAYTLEGTDNYVFLVLFRDPYDWVRSFHTQPHHGKTFYKKLSFDQFIRTPWELNPEEKVVREEIALNPLLDLNPKTGLPFENVLELRKAKIQTMLMIKEKVKNFVALKYETVLEHQEEFLKELSTIFERPLNQTFVPIDKYKNFGGTTYKPTKYVPITQEDLDYINSYLDEELENRIGYQIIRDVNIINSRESTL